MERTGRRTVPQIYIDGFHVGGYEDLVALDRAGGLDAAARRQGGLAQARRAPAPAAGGRVKSQV